MSKYGRIEQVDTHYRDDGRDDVGFRKPVQNTNEVLDAPPVYEPCHGEVVKWRGGPCRTQAWNPGSLNKVMSVILPKYGSSNQSSWKEKGVSILITAESVTMALRYSQTHKRRNDIQSSYTACLGLRDISVLVAGMEHPRHTPDRLELCKVGAA